MTDIKLATIGYSCIDGDHRPAPLRMGVPLSRGLVQDVTGLCLRTLEGAALPLQARALARWPDGSLRWVLVDSMVDARACGQVLLVQSVPTAPLTPAVFTDDENSLNIEAGGWSFKINRAAATLVACRGGIQVLGPTGIQPVLTTDEGRECAARFTTLRIEEEGPIRICVVASGDFPGARQPLQLQVRLTAWIDSSTISIETRLRNTRAAVHAGGLWDLGDPSSVRFADLSLRLTPAAVETLRWVTSSDGHKTDAVEDACLYQDSSGGERWDSPNHVDADGVSTVSFRGYQLRLGSGVAQRVIEEGLRASPCLTASGPGGVIALQPRGFWENFPMALRWRDKKLEVGLFPAESKSLFELQGGEQKRHEVLIDFSDGDVYVPVCPVEAFLAPDEVSRTHAVRYIAARNEDELTAIDCYVSGMVEGPHSVAVKRELVDEFGWRHFGDLYADHEAVRHTGPEPFISHYNNQYDFIFGAGSQFLRSGDLRWWRLMDEAARHMVDIDLYHVTEDKPAFNGGLFWHTDHYQPAKTCTHRTYSARNTSGDDYGGGPSNEHNYTSGLLLHHYLSGDPESADAVRMLADWVLAMDDGSGTLLGLFDEGPTGLASQTYSGDWHKPGRGAGNSINALLDAYQLDGQRRYLDAAEMLLRRCAHPLDDVPALRLDEPESRWSYLVFLQVLARYLDLKRELGEMDYAWHYGRACLLRYTEWMVTHEVPYMDVLHKVEIPTETWPAHDIRKAHVIYAAAEYVDEPQRSKWRACAQQFADRSLADVQSFATASLTRPQVIFCVYGHVSAYYAVRQALPVMPEVLHDFGQPVGFLSQRVRWRATLRRKLGVAVGELRRRFADLIGRRRQRKQGSVK